MTETRPGDPLICWLEEAPAEDEEISVEEEVAVQVALDELAAGFPSIPIDEIKREFGIEWVDGVSVSPSGTTDPPASR